MTPRATYRLQFTREFGFDAAASLAPYLSALGISHVYASPYLRARPGSTHGYDIVSHGELNPELGDAAAFARMTDAFRNHGLLQILDFVPNHMGVGGADNPLWLEVLEWGPEAPHAGWFDIDWEPAARYLTEKLLVPVLDEQYGAALESGKLVLKSDFERGEFAVWAHDAHKLPITPATYAQILGDEHPDLERFADLFSALDEWRPQLVRRAQDLKRELAALLAENTAAAQSLQRRVAAFNDGTEERRRLDALIQRQFWRASHFRVAGDDINYRRFFNVNDLAGLRIELPEVFEHAHALVLSLLREGVIDGLRIDHVDGLLDPAQYLERLRAAFAAVGKPNAWLVVEKILATDEALPSRWPVDGTTGYEFANDILQLLTDARGTQALTSAARAHTGVHTSFEDLVRDAKLFILENEMASELNVLARDTARVARQNSRTADFTRNLLHRALRATIACFPVYRSYLDSAGVLADDGRVRILRALRAARAWERSVDPSVFDFLELLLTGDLVAAPRSGFRRYDALRCAMKFQQLSGPVMAKGLEDTAFYRYNRLISHNEVGGDPGTLSASIEEFHARNQRRAQRTPAGMLATSTHDTKRGEDARLRLVTLAEIPEEWDRQVHQWRQELAAQSAALDDRNLEYFFYQTLLASAPAGELDSVETDRYRERLRGAMCKAAREARVRTSWVRPDRDYEDALSALVDAAFDVPGFVHRFRPFLDRVAQKAAANSLVQLVLKHTVPGVPDTYQGTELWDLNLVDPDNRRPVDFLARASLLAQLEEQWDRDPAGVLAKLSTQWRNGHIKLLLTRILLRTRTEHPRLFASGSYVPCDVGQAFGKVGAFIRRNADVEMLVVFARFPFARSDEPEWVHWSLPDMAGGSEWRDVLRRGPVSASVPVLDKKLPLAIWLRSAN